MLHILLLILKIIGIILAVILGILVLLVCIVIFVPVRYELSGSLGGTLSTLKAKGKVTWLCSLVRADIYYKENKLKWRLQIAWKKFLGGQEYGTDVPLDKSLPGDRSTQIKKTEGEEDEKRYEETWDKHEVNEESSKEDWRKAEEDKEAEDEEGQKGDEEDWYQSFEDEKDREESEEEFGEDEKIYEEILEGLEEEDSGDEKRDWKERQADEDGDHENGGRIRGFIQKIKELYGRIKCTIQNICDKIKKLLEKKNKIMGFIRDETHVGAFRKAKKEVFKLLKKLRPKKLLLEAEFGFDDPAWTGRTLAAIAPFYPLFGEFVSLRPDFTKRKLTGRLYVKGRIRFCHFAVMAWNLFWSGNVRKTYKDIRNFEI